MAINQLRVESSYTMFWFPPQSYLVADQSQLKYVFIAGVVTIAAHNYRCGQSLRLWCIQGIGQTKENKIRSDNTVSYKAVTTSSFVEKDKVSTSSRKLDRRSGPKDSKAKLLSVGRAKWRALRTRSTPCSASMYVVLFWVKVPCVRLHIFDEAYLGI